MEHGPGANLDAQYVEINTVSLNKLCNFSSVEITLHMAVASAFIVRKQFINQNYVVALDASGRKEWRKRER